MASPAHKSKNAAKNAQDSGLSGDHQSNADQEANGGHRRKHPWVEWFAIIIGGLAAGAAAWQGHIARDTEHRQLRAYVTVVDFRMVCCEVDREGVGYQDRAKFAFIQIKNGGQTPASKVWMGTSVREIPHAAPFPNIDYGPLGMVGRIESIVDRKIVIRPASFYVLQNGVETFKEVMNEPMMLRAKFSISDVIVYGTVFYYDVFGYPRYTDFCRIWSVTTDGADNYSDCPEHNGERD